MTKVIQLVHKMGGTVWIIWTIGGTKYYILREAYREFKNICMLWSIGKDSTVLLWLARKAFFGHVPIPLVHIDTHYKYLK